MKLCICTFHNSFSPTEVCGISSAPIYLYEQMRNHFDVDMIALRNNKKYQTSFANNITYSSDPSILSNYDFVIFAAPGLTCEKYDESDPNRYLDVISYAKKFTFMCHDENDRKLYPYYMNFLTHPNMKFVLFNCPTMGTFTFTDYVDIVGDWDYVSFCPTLPTKSEVLERARHKKDKVMSTCRWTTSKRIYEYLSLVEDFKANGIEVHTAGAHSSYWYNLRMEELPSDDYTDHGYFEPSQIPELLSDVKYHWNFLFQLRSMGRKTHQPRLELATMEALREGCLPIICKEFTPDWVGEDSAIRVSKDDYTQIPSILGNMSDEERLERIGRLYDLVELYILEHYKDVANHIRSVVVTAI